MKLFYSTGACSLSPHIVLQELGLPFEAIKVDLKTKKTQQGEDFSKISKKGYVPHLVLDNGEHLSEGVAIVQYLADLKPEANLIPKAGTFERVRMQEWLNYISTEIHKSHAPLFHPELGETVVAAYSDKIKQAYQYVADQLGNKKFLLGDQFTVADAYLFTVLSWAKYVKIDLNPYPTLLAYIGRVADRPQVQAALKAEGLA